MKETANLTEQLIRLTENKDQLSHLLNILETHRTYEDFAMKVIDKLLDRLEKK